MPRATAALSLVFLALLAALALLVWWGAADGAGGAPDVPSAAAPAGRGEPGAVRASDPRAPAEAGRTLLDAADPVPPAASAEPGSATDREVLLGPLGKPAATPGEPGSILVQVIAPDGSFATGAKVELLNGFEGVELRRDAPAVSPRSRGFRMHRGIPVAESVAKAGPDGEAELALPGVDAGALWLRGSGVGGMPTLLRLRRRPLDGERFRLVLDAGAEVRGVVHGVLPEGLRGPEGGEVTRATVGLFVHRYGSRQILRWIDLERGGAARQPFAFDGLPAGRYEVVLQAVVERGKDSAWVTWTEAPTALRARAGSVYEVDLVLPAAVERAAAPEIRCAMR